jgi:hypothetical protein
MRELLQANYQNHPEFKFEQKSWNLDKKQMELFTIAIGNSREKIRSTEANQALSFLDAIFTNFQTQSQNNFEKMFLSELHEELIKFYKSEFIFRRKLKSLHRDKIDDHWIELTKLSRFFGVLSNDVLSEIQQIMEPEIAQFRINASQNKLKRSDLSKNSGSPVDKINKLIEKDFKKQGVFKTVSKYVGIRYQTVGVSLELSVEGSTWWKNNQSLGKPPKTMYAHLDESIYAPKSIIYLTKVENENGPTSSYLGVYERFQNNQLQDAIGRVIGNVGNRIDSELNTFYQKPYHQSFASENFRRHFMKLPPELRFNSHLGWDVLADTDLENEIAVTEEVMLGPAGTFVVFDGSKLLHRGGLIEKGERIVLQVVFSPKASIIKRATLKAKKALK